MVKVGAAVASIAQLHRRLSMQKQSAVFDRLPDLQLRAVPRRGVPVGHVVIDLHPEVFQQVQYEDYVITEIINKPEMFPIKEDLVVDTLTKVVMTSSSFQSALVAFGVYDQVKTLGAADAARVLAEKLTYEHKIAEKVIKGILAARMKKLSDNLSEMDNLNKAQLVRDQAAKSSKLKEWSKKLSTLIWGSKE